MIKSIISTWHIMAAHFAASIPLFTSLLIVIGVISEILGYEKFSRDLTRPIHILSILSLLSLLIASAATLIDFPGGTFIASPFFRFKTLLAVTVFPIYSVIYFMFLVKGESIWDSKFSITYTLILCLIGGGVITILGSIGGYLSTGHTVLEAILKYLGLPL